MSRCRTYPIKTYQNNKKDSIIIELYNEYRIYCAFMIKKQYREYIKTGKLNKFIEIKQDYSLLSIRYKRIAVYQTIGQLQGWISNKNNKIKEIIQKCSKITKEQKRKLHLIRIFNIRKEQQLEIKQEKISITKDDIILFKAIKRSIRWKLPSSKRISMQLNNKVCRLVKKEINHKKHNATNFEYWIELSNLNKGKKLYIPANNNPYLIQQLQQGRLLNSIRIDFKNDKIIFNLMIDKEGSEEKINPEINLLGIDFGLKNLFALSSGQIFGVNFGKKLSKFDNRITSLQQKLQKQKIKPNKSKRYKTLIFKCQNFIENELIEILIK